MSILKRIMGVSMTVACAIANWDIGRFVVDTLTKPLTNTNGVNLLLAILGIPLFIFIGAALIGSIILAIVGEE